MSQKGTSAPIYLPDFFQTGKMDNASSVKDGYLTATCLLYPQRSAQEHEYMIRERCTVELDERGYVVCEKEAKAQAFQAAIEHLQQVLQFPISPVAAQPLVTVPQQAAAPVPTPVAPKAETSDSAEETSPPAKVTAPPPPTPPVQESAVETPPAPEPSAVEDTAPEDDGGEAGTVNAAADEEGAPVRLDMSQLRPASSLVSPQKPVEEPEDDEAGMSAKQYAAARNTEITICGKLHEVFKWPAGKILDEKPQFIVEFAQRYDGPRTEEKSALQTLYQDALRMCNNAA